MKSLHVPGFFGRKMKVYLYANLNIYAVPGAHKALCKHCLIESSWYNLGNCRWDSDCRGFLVQNRDLARAHSHCGKGAIWIHTVKLNTLPLPYLSHVLVFCYTLRKFVLLFYCSVGIRSRALDLQTSIEIHWQPCFIF